VHYVVGPAPADEGAEDVAEGVGDCGVLMGGLGRVERGCVVGRENLMRETKERMGETVLTVKKSKDDDGEVVWRLRESLLDRDVEHVENAECYAG
jgi:hypothetical protein